MLQIRNLSFVSWPYMISSSLALIAIMGTLLLPVFIFKVLKSKNLKDEILTKKYRVLFENYKVEKLSTSSFEVYNLLRKFLFAFGLVIFQDDSLR